jgi:AcrR family transcriptional regulator
MMRDSTQSRQQIMDAAADLFYREGYRAVGVDTIVAASGVGKMTLYRHFASKEELIEAYLHDADARFWGWFDAVTAPFAGRPRQQLEAFFAAVAALAGQPACYGCPFLNAVVDFPAPDHPGHQVAVANKQAVRARFAELAAAAGAGAPELLADQLFLLMDGAFMAVRTFGPAGPAQQVAEGARLLLACHLGPAAAPD